MKMNNKSLKKYVKNLRTNLQKLQQKVNYLFKKKTKDLSYKLFYIQILQET